MKNAAVVAVFLVLVACTVNMYDYSTSSGSGKPPRPDTVYIETGSATLPGTYPVPVPPVTPDTLLSRYPLMGGYVAVEECGSWSRFTLFGCKTETDGVALELRPVMVSFTSSDGSAQKEFQLEFTCRMQPHIIDSEIESSVLNGGTVSSSAGMIAMPVVTGTELVTLVANRTSFPFLAEQALAYDGNWLPDGTLMYDAVFNSSEWMVRDICSAEQLVASSESPDYRILFGDTERRLLQQFFDIFVVHGGEAPVLPVEGSGGSARGFGRQ